MYKKGDRIISASQASRSAAAMGISIEEWAANNGWTLDEGKQNDSTETDPPANQNTETSVGESNSGDISLGSPEPNIVFQQGQGVATYGNVSQEYTNFVIEPKKERQELNNQEYNNYTTSKLGVLDRANPIDATKVADPNIYNIKTTGVKGATAEDIYNVSWYGGTPTSTAEDVSMETLENPIDLSPGLSNAEYNPDGTTNFVDTYYNAFDLSETGIVKEAFEGWLIKNGYAENFEQDLLDGVYTSKWYDGAYIGDEDMTNEKAIAIAKENTLYRFLQDYVEETQSQVDKKNAINDFDANRNEFADAVGYENVLDTYYNRASESQSLEPLYDYNLLNLFNQNNFRQLNARNEKIAIKQAEEIKKEKERNKLQSFDNSGMQWLEATLKGFSGAGLDFIQWTESGIAGALGISDSYVDRQRLYRQETDAWDVKNLNYMSASGKKVSVGDTNYIVDNEGTIYDIDAGYIANGSLDEATTKAILEGAKKSEELASDINVRGGAVQMGAVMGNIGFQILATRGLGLGRAALSASYMAKANGFKSVAQYNKYLSMVQRGGTNMRGIKNTSTFGLKLPFNPAIAESTVFQTFYGAATGYEQTIMAAKNAGLTNKEAEDLASQAMLEMGILYGVTGPINPRIAAMKNLDDFLSRSGIANRAVRDYLKAGKNPIAFRESLKDGLVTFANVSKKFISEGSKEVVQENIQQFGETNIVNKRLNEAAGVDFVKDTYNRKDFIETSILSFASAGLLGSVNLSNVGFKPSNKQRLTNLYAFSKDMKGGTARLDAMVNNGKITRDQADEIIQQAGAVNRMADRIPSFLLSEGIQETDVVEILTLMSSVQDMEAQKKKMDKSMHGVIDASIEAANAKIQELSVEAMLEINLAKLRKESSVTTKLGKIAGSKVTTFNNKKEMEAAGFGDIDVNSDGLFMSKTGEIIINLEVAAERGAVSVGSHELLHSILRAEIKNNPEFKGRIINEFREILREKGMLEALDKRAQVKNEKGEQVYDITINEDGIVVGEDVDEYLNFFSDAIAKNEITFEQGGDSFWTKLGKWISKALKGQFKTKDIQFENGQQVFDFVRDYQASFQKGKLSAAAKAKARSSRNISNEGNKMSASDISAAADRAKQVLEKVSSNMDFFDPNSPLIARVLPGMIQAQLAKLSIKGLQFDMDEANSDIIYRLYSNGDINKFDGRGTLYGYINGRIAFRIKDMLKAAGEGKNDIVEDFNQSDVEDLKGAAADVTTTEQTEERVEDEKPEYRPLLNSRIAKPELIEGVLAKIPRIVGTLKSRIDAPISKNTTVTPLVNELRLALGKQVDIDLKKAMGGKKDGVLRRFLTDNKKAILENMTTTYLMSAFPAAVQKQVDGVFTSDWKGKKIDRETTSTDKAGRTSGAELVRRLPNASTKIDDKTFLSFILDEKGNPLRGKKESLAKAIGEELAIEIINQEMQNPDSQIRQAFEANQERLGVELVENYVTKLQLDFERGNVKRSVTAEDIDLIQQAAILKLQGKEVEYNITLQLISPDQRKQFEIFVAKEIVGSATSGFGNYISNIEPASPEFANSIENFEAFKASPKEKSKAILDFNTAIINKLDPAVQSAIGDVKSFFDSVVLEKDTKTNKRKDYIRERFATRRTRPSRLSKEEQAILKNAKAFTAGDLLSKNIREILAETTTSPVDKINKIKQKYGEEIDKRNEANLLAMKYYWEAVYDVLLDDPSLATGMLLHIQSISNSRANIASMTTLKDIEVYSENQAPYINPKTNERVWLTYPKAIGKLKRGELIVNVNHPLYKEAQKFATTSKKPVAAFLETYHEHASPLSKINAAIFEQIQRHASAVKLNPAQTIVRKRLFKESLNSILNRFEQQITSSLSAAISDIGVSKGGFGKTSEAGDFRMTMLPPPIKNNIYEISSGLPAINRIDQKIKQAFPEGLKINEDQVAKQTSENKKSVTIPTAIFMVGGPGSGKSSIVGGLDLIEKGYRYVNQDPYLEEYIREAGLPTDEKTYDKEQRSLRAKLGWKARKAAEEDLARHTAARESMVVDGTGASYKATTKKMKALEAAGFEIHMVFVNTSKDVAVKRNRNRSERSLADFIVTKTWDSVQESAAQYREDYAGRFYEINTDNLSYNQSLPKDFVDAVDNGLNQSQVKRSVSLNQEFNEMIERTKGVSADKVYSAAQARMQGEKKGKYRLFVPASAEDFRGLTSYTFAGKGKQGEADQKFIEDNLITPYIRGIAMIEAVKQQVRREYNALAKESKQYFKMLGKKIGDTNYTYDQALRVYMWTQQGIEVPGMSKDDIAMLIKEISQIPGLIQIGNAMQAISRQDTWMEPGEHWLSRTLISDLNGMTEKVGRKKYLQEFIENSDVIFSDENLNKIEAVYGTRHREAIEDALFAMKNGTNRTTGTKDKQVNAWLNWVNNSTGAIMFFNIRSAVLQTLSATNFINWSDNNPVKAAAAFANQKQYWSDFAMIFNSDKLKQRRSGLQTDVNQAEIANQAEGAKDKAGAVISYLLKIGFTPTQIADSFAISMGGATFYRNRVKTYLKEGMEQEAAEKQAFEDFSKTADEAQQSSDPYLVSQEQRSVLGRLVLAFQNTPMQYTRLMKKAMKDLANGRGDAKTHISKIIYYGAVQNFIFSALQNALFAVIPGFDDEDESEMTEAELEKLERKNDKRTLRIINNMTDSILKGSGVRGAALATIKNTVTEYFAQKEKGFMADRGAVILQVLSLSPPIGSKLRKINSALAGEAFNKDVLEARGFSVTKDGRVNLSPAYSIIGSLVSGVANIPMDRMVDIINGYSEALDSRNTTWQRIALALGWKTWDVGAKNEEHDQIKIEAKEQRKEEGKAKAKKTREDKKKKENAAAAAIYEKQRQKRIKELEEAKKNK
jgi:shikimate kinase